MQVPDLLHPSTGASPATGGGTQDMSSLSPICCMSTDVMANVFEHCVHELGYYPRVGKNLEAPLSLSQVCRSWRKLSFALPCLWTRFEVIIGYPVHPSNWDRSIQSMVMSVRLWLSRSQPLPVYLYLCSAVRDMPVPLSALELFDREILKASSRIKKLSLCFPAQFICHLLSFTQGSLESLEYLSLRGSSNFSANEHNVMSPLVLRSAPGLRSLCLTWYDLDMRNFQVPWAQLTKLNLLCDFFEDFEHVHSDYLPVLAQCPNLRTCSLALGWPLDDDFSVTSVTLPHLNTLEVTIYVWAPYVKRFFGALHLPKLQSFDISNTSLERGSFGTRYLQMLSRAAETVESVTFSSIDIPGVKLSACLSQLPNLKSLQYTPSSRGLNHNLVATLTIVDAQSSGGDLGDKVHHQPICPSLEALRLCCSDVVHIDAVVALVASRCQSEPRLRHFTLQLERPGEFADDEGEGDRREEMISMLEARLSRYVDEGLQLTLINCGRY
ncbi:hypothetical protein BKA82DRAFT_4121929 [Pisolithus tinctorius]|nr:hypothetical protein BKA82DRAFT_4121929 [Pisolithus tinctorius]